VALGLHGFTMQGPPAASLPVGRSRWHIGAIAATGLPALLGCTLLLRQISAEMAALAFLCLSCLLGFAIFEWLRSELGMLRWDGQHWLWTGFGDASVAHLEPILDLQSVVLVRVRSDQGKTEWLWLEAKPDALQWRSIRRAVYAQGAPS